VLVDGVDDPVDAGVVADGFMGRIDKDNLVVFEGRILVDPVGIENAKVSTNPSDTVFGNGLEVAVVLELVHSVGHGLTVGLTLGDGPLAASTANADSVDNVSLLGLVTHPAGLIRAGGAGGTVDGRELAELPASDAVNKAKHIRLLLFVEFLEILVGYDYQRFLRRN